MPGYRPGCASQRAGRVEPEELWGNLAVTEDLNRHCYEIITGGMPVGWYIVALCYATAVILLGWLPWNILLILFLFSSSKHLRFSTFDTMPSGGLGSSQ
jgi:hypothetical protein